MHATLSSKSNRSALRILLVAQHFNGPIDGGAERVAKQCANALMHNHHVEILSLEHQTSESPLVNAPVHRVPYKSQTQPTIGKFKHLSPLAKAVWHGKNSLGGVHRSNIQSVLDRVRPDVIYAHNVTAFQPTLGALAAERTIPIVQHLHDYAYLCPRTTMFDGKSNCQKACGVCKALTHQWRKAANASTTDVIAVSAFLRDRMQNSGVCQDARWHVMHNVLHNDLHDVLPEVLPGVQRLKVEQATTQPTFAYVGALERHKGLDLLIDAFLDLNHSNAKLLIAGSGRPDYVNPLKERTQNKAVEWLGHVDPREVYARVRVVIIPSLWHEPQALVVREALNAGTFIIASKRGGNTEILQDTTHAMLFEPDDPGALKRAMQQIVDDPPCHKDQHSNSDEMADYTTKLEEILWRATQTWKASAQ